VATLSVNLAKKIMEDLRTGVPTSRYVSSYSVGRGEDIARLRDAMNDANSGHPQVLFIRGDWGAGKSHILRLFEERANDANFLISHVELSSRETPLSCLHLVYSRIMSNLRSNSESAQNGLVEMLDKLGGVILEKAEPIRRQKCKHNILYENCSHLCLPKELSRDLFPQLGRQDVTLVTALQLFVWATLRNNEKLKAYVGRWLLGETLAKEEVKWMTSRGDSLPSLPKSVGQRQIITLLRNLSTWARLAGYGGMGIFFDEAESIPSLGSGESQAYVNFAWIVDTIRKSGNIMFIYATTPTFYEDAAERFINLLRDRRDLTDFANFLESTLVSQTVTLESLTSDDLMSLAKNIAHIAKRAKEETLSSDEWRNMEPRVKALVQEVRSQPAWTTRQFVTKWCNQLSKSVL